MLKVKSQIESPKYLYIMAMLYATINVASTSLVYKIVSFGAAVITAGALLSPLWYLFGDIIAEVYGYKQARKVIWVGLFCELVFISFCSSMIHLPSPAYWHYQNDYNVVLGRLPRIYIGSIVGTLAGSFLNAFIITKTKIVAKGKYFWLRSILSNAVGQFVFSFATAFTDLFGVIPVFDVIKVVIVSYIVKVCFLPILAMPSSIIASYLKQLEGVDVYDIGSSFNPFRGFSEREEDSCDVLTDA